MLYEEEIPAEDQELLNYGAYGRVYLLKKRSPKTVIKYIFGKHENYEEMFEKECTALEGLHHPNIVQFLGKHCSRTWCGVRNFGILMEYCERGSLDQTVLNPQIIYSIYTVICWAEQLASALVYLNAMKTVHRDIKPANILVTEEFTVKLGDFGNIKVIDETCTTTMIGTPRYLSPEVWENFRGRKSKISTKSDIYGFGLVLWEMIERRVITVDHKKQEIDPPKCPEKLQELVMRCASFEYELRPRADEKFSALIRENKQELELETRFDFRPFVDEHQKSLIRPIGFDLTVNKVPVYDEESLEWKNASLFSLTKTQKEPVTEPKKDFDHKTMITKSRYPDDLKERFEERIDALSNEEKAALAEQAPTIILAKLQEPFLYQDTYGYRKFDYKPRTAREIVEALLDDSFHSEASLFSVCFSFISEATTRTFGSWEMLESLSFFLTALNEMKQCSFTKRLYFECYQLNTRKDEWLLISSKEWKSSEFIKKDLSELREIKGEWREREFWVEDLLEIERQQKGLPWLRFHGHNPITKARERMIFLRQEPVDLDLLAAAIHRLRFRLQDFARLEFYSFIHSGKPVFSTELPVEPIGRPFPGYIFGIRRPPRHHCRCAQKCPIQGGFPLDVPQDAQVLYHQCATIEEIDFIELYTRIWIHVAEHYRRGVSKEYLQARNFLVDSLLGKPTCPQYMLFYEIVAHEEKFGGMTMKIDDGIVLDHPAGDDQLQGIFCRKRGGGPRQEQGIYFSCDPAQIRECDVRIVRITPSELFREFFCR